jgi:hypothetical protein
VPRLLGTQCLVMVCCLGLGCKKGCTDIKNSIFSKFDGCWEYNKWFSSSDIVVRSSQYSTGRDICNYLYFYCSCFVEGRSFAPFQRSCFVCAYYLWVSQMTLNISFSLFLFPSFFFHVSIFEDLEISPSSSICTCTGVLPNVLVHVRLPCARKSYFDGHCTGRYVSGGQCG